MRFAELIIATATVTRPADTTTYTAGDAIGTAATSVIELTVNSAGLAASGYLTRLRVSTNNKDFTSALRALLYNASPESPAVDNAAISLLWANDAKRVASFDLAALATEGSGSNCAESNNNDLRIAFFAPAGKLYLVLREGSGKTPASGQVFNVTACFDVNQS